MNTVSWKSVARLFRSSFWDGVYMYNETPFVFSIAVTKNVYISTGIVIGLFMCKKSMTNVTKQVKLKSGVWPSSL